MTAPSFEAAPFGAVVVFAVALARTASADVSIGAVTDVYVSHHVVTVGGINAKSNGIGVHAGVGVARDRVLVSLELATSLYNFATDDPITLTASYAIIRTGRFEVGASVGGALVDRTARLELGIGARYEVAPNLTAFIGGVGERSRASSFGAGLALGPLMPMPYARELEVARGATTFDVPLGISAHVAPPLTLGLGTSISADVPLELAALVHAGAVDITAFVAAPDLRHEQLALVFAGLGVRYVR